MGTPVTKTKRQITADIRAAVRDAIALRGTQAALADAAGCSQHAIWKASKFGRVSPSLAVKIHAALDGAVPKERLCPEIFSPVTA